nr:YutD-like domain-containing protein [Cohnella kolymensis]
MAGGNAYSLLHEHKNGWNPEAFHERYSEVLERFDYVVGDWGYSQLRLRGFYRDGHPKATKDSTISSLVDYINEYCNFGCAYFVLGKLDSANLSDEQKSALQVLPEISAALNEAGEQAAETAAALSGPLMRWPLKERAGGPARVPNVTVSAVARAAAESAERRNAANQNVNASGSTNRGGGSSSRPGQDGGNSNKGRSYGGPSGADRRQGQAGAQSAGKSPVQQRGSRVQASGEAGRPNNEDTRFSEGGNIRPDSSKNGSRWPGKNRRRKTFGGKPNHRAEGGPRPDNGSTRSGE